MSSHNARAHRWEWDEDALSGQDYGYCLNRCGVEWHDGDSEPSEPCVPLPAPPVIYRMTDG